MKPIKLSFTLIVLLSIAINGFGQRKLKFDKITVDNGLSQSDINWITQDKYGFIWIATDGGLNKFDGSQFVSYIHNISDSNSISNNIVIHIYEDTEGLLWIATQNG